MKIFILRNAWKTTDFGGAEELALNLVSELINQHQNAFLITGTKTLLLKSRKASIPVIIGPYSKRQILTKHRFIFIPIYLFDLYIAYRKYIKLFSIEKPDIIHTTGQQDSISATSAATKLGIPVIWSDHGELKNSVGFKLMPPWGIAGYLLKKRLSDIKALLMVNPSDIEFVRSININIPIRIVPNGIPDKINTNKIIENDIVFASRVIREKGIFELINAFEVISVMKPKTNLLIAGEGPALSKVKEMVKRRKLKKITFSSYSDKMIENARIFVLPTYSEAQSLAILKAMMYKTPVVTTGIDGNKHFLEHRKTAILVDSQDSKSLADGILFVQENRNIAKNIALNARKQYEQKNELGLVVEKYYIPIYNEISNSVSK